MTFPNWLLEFTMKSTDWKQVPGNLQTLFNYSVMKNYCLNSNDINLLNIESTRLKRWFTLLFQVMKEEAA